MDNWGKCEWTETAHEEYLYIEPAQKELGFSLLSTRDVKKNDKSAKTDNYAPKVNLNRTASDHTDEAKVEQWVWPNKLLHLLESPIYLVSTVRTNLRYSPKKHVSAVIFP